ncbi:hypothetical protein SAMN05877831_101658 [Rhodobacter maris]|uniref:tRNA A-37 threonylcarbamoyl transferase component Bud32 n=1 Tax=Rhodobacter maris TaxID=446682 RepID=A0A285RL54_9RHOB|nr:hypothetical protein SAMN05877831_101658 [Rhodobacter maris]
MSGQPGWRKRVEDVGLRLRLQKGDPRQLFEAERQAYLSLQGKHLPFPRLLDSRPGEFVLADAGPSVKAIILREGAHSVPGQAAIVAAAEALARLHRAGYSHGRPSLRDICYQDGTITFIDLEKYRPDHNNPSGHVWDLLIFFFDICIATGRLDETVLAARDAYRAADSRGIWARAERKMRHLRPVWALLRPLTWRWLSHHRDFRAIAPLCALFSRGVRPDSRLAPGGEFL